MGNSEDVQVGQRVPGREGRQAPTPRPCQSQRTPLGPPLSGSLSWCIILQCLEQKELRGNHGVSQLELCRLQNRNCLHLT